MVGYLIDVVEAPKGPSLPQYVEIMKTTLVDLQTQTKKRPLVHRKTAPTGLFCMSGPVAHADDDEDDEAEAVSKDKVCEYDGLESKLSIATKEEMNVMRKDMHATACEKGENGDLVKHYWAEGCFYEGKCAMDQNSIGRGKICWPSGSYYEGEVTGGHLHGVGTFRGADGMVYKGNWIMSKKHGYGWKRYANGDVYEGAWKWDVPDGQGRYIWSHGSEYYGGWKAGMMCGRGVLVWTSGDKYDGHWFDGVPDGHGVYTWVDGSTYFGRWRKGLKHGKGKFFPPGSKRSEREHLCTGNLLLSEGDGELGDGTNASPNSGRQKICSPSHVPQELRSLGLGLPANSLALGVVASSLDTDEDSRLVLERLWRLENFAGLPAIILNADYSKYRVDGSEETFSCGEDLSHSSEADFGQPKWFSEERKRQGEKIHKGHPNYDLMVSLQLGIRHSVGKVMPEQQRKKLASPDFGSKARAKVFFPREGSHQTPPHQAIDFRWKDYCPTVFRHLRELFKVDVADYMLSICGDNGLRELSSPGKSGSVFYLTQDERFMIKTLRKTEVKVLLKMLPRYYNHVKMHENTLLTRFLGLHRFQNANGQKVRFIIMRNVVCADSWIHRRFDLKGSSHGRSTEKDETDDSTTLKDLDLEFVFQLDQSWRDAILEQISEDCKFLESENIMDYSLLLGLHFKGPAFKEVPEESSDLPLHDVVLSRFVAESGGFVEIEVTPKQLASKRSGLELENDVLGRQGSLKHFSGEDSKWALIPHERCNVHIGYNMPARACRRLPNGKHDPNSKDVCDVLLYFGVIDILQEYGMGKKLEHAYKSFQFDALSISAVDPVLYSKRFQHFMHEIFIPDT